MEDQVAKDVNSTDDVAAAAGTGAGVKEKPRLSGAAVATCCKGDADVDDRKPANPRPLGRSPSARPRSALPLVGSLVVASLGRRLPS